MPSQPFPARSYDLLAFGEADNLIGGQRVPASTGESLEVENPRHGRAMGRVGLSGAADVDTAVLAAEKAQPGWEATPLKERAGVLFRFRELMAEHIDELGWLVSHENGKTFSEGRASVAKGIECLEYGLCLENLAQGEKLEVSRGIDCEVQHSPLGVVAGVVPFNFPIMVPMWMLPQALVAGNAFLIKPSEQVPFGVTRLAELLSEAGLPDGVLNVVQGGRAAVEALVDHPGIVALGFVGSTRVARLVYGRGAALGKRMLCLGGAKNHLVVVPDADLELTAQTVVASSFGCAGQRCMAASVMVGVGDVEAIVARMVEYADAITLGEDMGAIINGAALERITRSIDEAERMGAKVLVDGRGARVEGAGGYWLGPTILDHVTPDMPCASEEIFGPVLSILRVDSLDQAIALENDNPYGNAAAIFTTSGGVARYAIERFESGMCGVNIGVPVPREPFAFGGWNDSRFGHGDMTGWDGYRFWTRAKKVTTRWEVQRDATWMS